MTKFPEEQTPDNLESVVRVTEYWWDIQLWWEVSRCEVLLVRQGSNVPENLPQGKGTTGKDAELSGGCLGSQLAELTLPTLTLWNLWLSSAPLYFSVLQELWHHQWWQSWTFRRQWEHWCYSPFRKCLSLFVPWLSLFLHFNFKKEKKKNTKLGTWKD